MLALLSPPIDIVGCRFRLHPRPVFSAPLARPLFTVVPASTQPSSLWSCQDPKGEKGPSQQRIWPFSYKSLYFIYVLTFMIQPIDTVESKLDTVDSLFGSNVGSVQTSVRFRSRCSRTTSPRNLSVSGFPRLRKPQVSFSLSLARSGWVGVWAPKTPGGSLFLAPFLSFSVSRKSFHRTGASPTISWTGVLLSSFLVALIVPFGCRGWEIGAVFNLQTRLTFLRIEALFRGKGYRSGSLDALLTKMTSSAWDNGPDGLLSVVAVSHPCVLEGSSCSGRVESSGAAGWSQDSA